MRHVDIKCSQEQILGENATAMLKWISTTSTSAGLLRTRSRLLGTWHVRLNRSRGIGLRTAGAVVSQALATGCAVVVLKFTVARVGFADCTTGIGAS